MSSKNTRTRVRNVETSALYSHLRHCHGAIAIIIASVRRKHLGSQRRVDCGDLSVERGQLVVVHFVVLFQDVNSLGKSFLCVFVVVYNFR